MLEMLIDIFNMDMDALVDLIGPRLPEIGAWRA